MRSSGIESASSFTPAVVQPRKTTHRRTSFAAVSVREFDQTIGDSPSCLDGAPVALGWSFQEYRDIPFEEYEQSRQPFRRRRSDLVLGVRERRSRLVESGVSLSDVLKAESLASLKKSASRLCLRKDANGKDLKGTKEKAAVKDIDQREKRASPPRTSPPLQKQMTSRAA